MKHECYPFDHNVCLRSILPVISTEWGDKSDKQKLFFVNIKVHYCNHKSLQMDHTINYFEVVPTLHFLFPR
jgi:hypothetical protein